ncbi:MAG: TIGR00730 family Rossman fold protein [Candidatus Spechtbacterales bacterium]|nr:TIGR00730 family Rossman fold protein [Candidatus Spechtbacterales bacterium]
MRKKDKRKIPKEPRIKEFTKSPLGRKEKRLKRIEKEFRKGFDFLEKYEKAATIFGTARYGFDDEIYQKAEKLSAMLADRGYAVITGGGPGVMEAANKGAHSVKGTSVGINIQLKAIKEDKNKYVQESESFKYFFSRKMMLAYASQLYFFFPGGFGTLDEFFEMVTLIQTEKIKPIPIILVQKSYWEPLLEWISDELVKNKAINPDDMDIYRLVDTPEEAIEVAEELLEGKTATTAS